MLQRFFLPLFLCVSLLFCAPSLVYSSSVSSPSTFDAESSPSDAAAAAAASSFSFTRLAASSSRLFDQLASQLNLHTKGTNQARTFATLSTSDSSSTTTVPLDGRVAASCYSDGYDQYGNRCRSSGSSVAAWIIVIAVILPCIGCCCILYCCCYGLESLTFCGRGSSGYSSSNFCGGPFVPSFRQGYGRGFGSGPVMI